MVPRFRECCRQSQAEVVSKSSEKIHQTWTKPFSRYLYDSALRWRDSLTYRFVSRDSI